MKVVIVGGVAAGPKAASKIIRMRPDTDVTVVEKGLFLSYAGCGLPYYVSGEIKEQKELMETPAGVEGGPDVEAEILEWARERLAKFKLPRSVDFVDALPREPNGKLIKRKLRDPYWADHDANI